MFYSFRPANVERAVGERIRISSDDSLKEEVSIAAVCQSLRATDKCHDWSVSMWIDPGETTLPSDHLVMLEFDVTVLAVSSSPEVYLLLISPVPDDPARCVCFSPELAQFARL